ncbi:MAG: hypothetical protein HXX11_21145 [Desulfuromonadales bacterium]|nr:hypothetical protein [Desulfuromonadales bacterium]
MFSQLMFKMNHSRLSLLCKEFMFLLCITLVCPLWCRADNPVSLEVGSNGNDTDSRVLDPTFSSVHSLANKKKVYSLRVGSVAVEGRWKGPVELPIVAGDVLTPSKIFDSMEALEKIITNNSINGYGLRSKGEIGVLYIEVDYDSSHSSSQSDAPEKTVNVRFRPHYVQFSLLSIGDNVLPIPRSALPTFYKNVPKPLLALNPTMGVFYDRSFGLTIAGSFEADLLNLSDPGHLSTTSDENRHVTVQTHGMKSLQDRYYRIDSGVNYVKRQVGSTLQEFSVRADYVGVNEPLGNDKHVRNAGFGAVGATFKLAPHAYLSLDTGYRRTDDGMDSTTSERSIRTSSNEQINRLLIDAVPPDITGFLRAAVWEDNGWLTGSGRSHQKLAVRLGYAKEIPLRLNETIGLELLVGGGKIWGEAPDHALFFAGNLPGQFLYDSRASVALMSMPSGPLIRSFGQGEAGFRTNKGSIRGGDAFWHVNVNISYPMRCCSRALIPNELTDLEDEYGKPSSLKQLLNRQIDVTGLSMLAATLRKEGMSTEEADKKAGEILDEVKPATHFIIDYANLYSIKPLLMFDAGGMTSRGHGSGETWLAAGGGVQLTVVIAKFELGYMQTLSGPTFGSRGNGFARLVFQNLF